MKFSAQLKFGLLSLCLILSCQAPPNEQTNEQTIEQTEARPKLAQERAEMEMPGLRIIPYKQVGEEILSAHLMPATTAEPAKAVIAFFHGGGWVKGRASNCYPWLKHLSAKGYDCISFEYRLAVDSVRSILACLEDAKSAIRWIRRYGPKHDLDSSLIVAAGLSAGGHLAACTEMIQGFEDSSDLLEISSRPDALMLWFPGLNTMVAPPFKQLMMGCCNARDLSPAHHIRAGLAPCLIFHGVQDQTVPFWTIRDFDARMNRVGNDCQLHAYQDAGHVLTNEAAYMESSLLKAEQFLNEQLASPNTN